MVTDCTSCYEILINYANPFFFIVYTLFTHNRVTWIKKNLKIMENDACLEKASLFITIPNTDKKREYYNILRTECIFRERMIEWSDL